MVPVVEGKWTDLVESGMAGATKFGIGQPVRRSEDIRLITGHGRYTDDISAPGQAYGVFVRSPHAHAVLRGLDLGEARAMPGVLGILTAAELAADGVGLLPCDTPLKNRDGSMMALPPRPALAEGRVRHVGDPVALVVAETLDQAKDAAERIAVDYAPLPATVDTAGALAEGAVAVWDDLPGQPVAGNLAFDWELGSREAADAAFASAAHIVALDLVNNRVVASPMETRGCLAEWDAAERRLTFTVSSQGVHSLRDSLADILGLEPESLRVLTGDVGGGFGMKIFLYPEYPAVLAAARRLGRPVKWISERTEAFLSDDHGRDHVTHAELALDAEGVMLAVRTDTIANLGAYLSSFGPFIPTLAGSRMLCGLYRIGSVHVRVRGVYTHTQPVDAYRGAGRPEAAFVLERLVDLAARRLGLSPAELRRRNFIPPSALPYRTATGLVYDSGDFQRNLDDALALADTEGFAARKAASRTAGKLRGLGIATYVEACAGFGSEAAVMRVDRSGGVTVLIGTQSNGQGHETAYQQIVAEHLGVPPERVTVVQGDTDLIATGGGTGGSRSVPIGGAAVGDAALRIQAKAKARAAELMEAAVADVEFVAGRFAIVGTDRSLDLGEIAATAAEDIAFDETGGFKPPASTFPNGAHLCEVEVDPETGGVAVVGYTVVDDFGRVMNPLLVEGQVHGGIGQGLGQALLERTVFDPDTGQLLTATFMDYAMPHARDLPSVAFRFNEVPCKTNPLGLKGAGEAGAIGAPPAVINAVVDALAEFGIEHVDMPATPLAVWQAIRDATAGGP